MIKSSKSPTLRQFSKQSLPHEPSGGERIIRFSKNGVIVTPPRSADPFPNAIHTTRFTLLTWIPKSLFIQLHRVANNYFVLVAILTLTPFWEGSKANKAMNVTIIMLIQAFKDLYEDRKRLADDTKENGRPFERWNTDEKKFETRTRQECQTGDVICVKKDDILPADCVILASESDTGLSYVSTVALDGETNLKQRHGIHFTQQIRNALKAKESFIESVFDSNIEITFEAPKADLAVMNGKLDAHGDTFGLRRENCAVGGVRLKNTKWIVGVIIYVGKDTKMVLNSATAPSKISELELFLNYCVIGLLCLIFGSAFLFAILGQALYGHFFPRVFVRYSVILYNILPMSLYVIFELLKTSIGLQIDRDSLMRDEDTNDFAKARNTAVVEEMGQVNFIFSDKTGTLTANEMRFAACCIDDKVFSNFLPDKQGHAGASAEQLKAMLSNGTMHVDVISFFRALAVCHAVQVDEDGTYQAESPDEVALVLAARCVGIRLDRTSVSASGTKTEIVTPWGPEVFHIAQLIEFSSDRKRMSVVCARQDGGARIITKGADSVMEKLMTQKLPTEATQALHHFALQGLRTLVVACREMDAATYTKWCHMWDAANASMENREQQLAHVAAEAEVDLKYMGVTALEDRLQDEVPQSIATFRQAGIRVWVLTGDKVETAVEIAKSCRLFDADMKLVWVLGQTSAEGVISALQAKAAVTSDPSQRGIVLDGQSASYALENHRAGEALYTLARESSSCVCCRLSPLQKRQLVELVRKLNGKAITLSIGDGANDVPMIQGAHLGIGIRGKEGAASVQASDMALSQFRFLRNLLLYHGKKAYRRAATFLCFFTYKSVVVGTGYIIYAFSVEYSGKLGYPEWLDFAYNGCTSASCAVCLLFDEDYSPQEAISHPALYRPGMERWYLNLPGYIRWMFFALLHGTLAWVVPVFLLCSAEDREQQTESFYEASFVAFSVVIITVHIKLIIVAQKPIPLMGWLLIVAEFVEYVCIAAFLGFEAPLGLPFKLAEELIGVPQKVMTSGKHLACLFIVPVLANIPDFFDEHLKHLCNRTQDAGDPVTQETLIRDADAHNRNFGNNTPKEEEKPHIVGRSAITEPEHASVPQLEMTSPQPIFSFVMAEQQANAGSKAQL